LSKAKIKEIEEELVKTGSVQNLAGLPEELRKTFVVAMDISAEDHMKMQAAFQKNVDNSISKTINFPNSATKEEVANGFLSAWRLKCKSATVYRDGTRDVQVLNLGTGENIKSIADLGKGGEVAASVQKTEAIPAAVHPDQNVGTPLPMDKVRLGVKNRPDVMAGKTYKIKTGYGNLYVTVNNDEQGEPFEVFATIGKSGGFFQEQSEGICRMVSLGLRSGIKVQEIISHLKGIRGPMPMLTNKGTVLSLPDAIGQILEEHVKEPEVLEGPAATPSNIQEPVATMATAKFDIPTAKPKASVRSIADFGMMPGCPDCGNSLRMAEGCMSCPACGFSRCV